MEGKTALGASSPAKPALHMPEPLSQTRAATSSSHILGSCLEALRVDSVQEGDILGNDLGKRRLPFKGSEQRESSSPQEERESPYKETLLS